MSEEIILQIGNRIKEIRGGRNITLDQLATKAGVSKALISQIENNRTVPSLPVLLSIVHSLGENVTEFFDGMSDVFSNTTAVLIKSGKGIDFQKEPVKGLQYARLVTQNVYTQTVDVVLLTLSKGAGRKKMISTDAWECKHMLKGSIEYEIEKEKYFLEEGDTIFFDGRKKHRLRNVGKSEAQLLVIYLF